MAKPKKNTVATPAATLEKPDTVDATCPHCRKTVVVDSTDSVEMDDNSTVRPVHSYNSKTHMPGHWCEHCGGPLDMVALTNTNINYGDENSRKNLYADLKAKVEAFQNSL